MQPLDCLPYNKFRRYELTSPLVKCTLRISPVKAKKTNNSIIILKKYLKEENIMHFEMMNILKKIYTIQFVRYLKFFKFV